jgi:hypothetical protein
MASDDNNDGMHVPFPELADRSNELKLLAKMPKKIDPLRSQGRSRSHGSRSPVHKAQPQAAAPSAPLPLPKSHIHRTPSELQFEASLLHYEHSDVCMYARLVRGMTERGAGYCPGADHLGSESAQLSRKSLMGVVESRRRVLEDEGLRNSKSSVQDDWEYAYDFDENRAPSQGRHPYSNFHDGASTGFPSQPLGRTRRDVSMSLKKEEEEDDCLFSLEL